MIKRDVYSLRLSELRGFARKYPIAVAALVVSHLSMVGFPLLSGFPSRLGLWQELATYSLSMSFWVFVGVLGLFIAAIRTTAVFVMADEGTDWRVTESWVHIVMLGVGIFGLFLLGVFPQVLQPFLKNLPALFEHLGR